MAPNSNGPNDGDNIANISRSSKQLVATRSIKICICTDDFHFNNFFQFLYFDLYACIQPRALLITFIRYFEARHRLGVIKIPSKMVKDFYILPLTLHKSLPSILKSTTGFDLGTDRPDLLLGIIVRNRITPTTVKDLNNSNNNNNNRN